MEAVFMVAGERIASWVDRVSVGICCSTPHLCVVATPHGGK